MRRYIIILLTLITAVIHIYFYTTYPHGLMFTLFLLNGLGYLGLLGLLYLPLGLPEGLHRLVRPLFIGYTLLTIVLYVVLSAPSRTWDWPLAPLAKVAEAILVWQLWAEGRAEAHQKQTALHKSDAML